MAATLKMIDELRALQCTMRAGCPGSGYESTGCKEAGCPACDAAAEFAEAMGDYGDELIDAAEQCLRSEQPAVTLDQVKAVLALAERTGEETGDCTFVPIVMALRKITLPPHGWTGLGPPPAKSLIPHPFRPRQYHKNGVGPLITDQRQCGVVTNANLNAPAFDVDYCNRPPEEHAARPAASS